MMKLSEVDLKPEERLDDLIYDDLQIIQNEDHFSFAIDAVLLSDFINVSSGDKVIDLGTGTGVIPLLVAVKKAPQQIIGVELQSELVEMAQRSVRYNNLEHIIQIKEANIRELPEKFAAGSFELVVSNPPYLPLGQGQISSNSKLAMARHEIMVELEDIVKVSAYLVKYGGEVSYVYRSERLDELLRTMNEYNLQPKRLRLVHPEEDKDCNLILVTGIKGANPGLEIEPPLVIYRASGKYTEEVLEIYYGSNYEDKVVD